MRAPAPPSDIAIIAAQFEAAPGIDRVRAIHDGFAAATPETVAAILEEASRFAQTWLVPLNDASDAQGCRLANGRVTTATGHREAWQEFVAGGWSTLDHPEAIGGQGLPLALGMAVQAIFDRACPAFGMLPVPQRSAAKLIAAHAEAAIRDEWLPRLVAGEWGATICISEPEAGSDVGRIRTRAEPNADGTWSITGEKCWISFGDHDLSPRIGHCLLARTPGAAAGGGGLSLFLVPDTIGEGGTRNGVVTRRIEHKMGLHGSPTCALGFEGAIGRLIGVEGRGLAQMFVMITNMRLSVGAQGVGIASAAADTALAYARERKQGGAVDAPVAIIAHADVQRELFGAVARVETLRGLLLATANQAEIAAYDPDPEARLDAQALVQFLLPIIKTLGGQYGFEVANAAIQVLGGAGYTREWPVEQAARDARVLTIYEGTTGIQALDLLNRRILRGDRRGFGVFLRLARADAGDSGLGPCLDRLEATTAQVMGAMDDENALNAGATAYLQLVALVATGWIAARLSALDGDDPASARLRAAGAHWLVDLDARCALCAYQVKAGRAMIAQFAPVVDG